jgi:hypothetical protein
LAQQRGVRALLDEQAVLHDEDEVGVDDRLQLVRHHHGGHVPARGVDHLDHRALDERVERARRLVAQQQPRRVDVSSLFSVFPQLFYSKRSYSHLDRFLVL